MFHLSLYCFFFCIDIIETGLEMAKKDGILYLGTCGPEYKDNETTMLTSSDRLIHYRRGFYFCTHAIAYKKWRARTFWGELAAYRFLHNEIGSDTIARKWQILSNTYPISVASNIHWPQGAGHYGFFYQARGRFESIIQG